jgi:hypothetical protein
MKYFTPERWLRLQHDDRDVFNQAMEDWEQAIDDYRTYINANLTSRSRDLYTFATGVSLHDAALIESWKEGKQLCLLLRPEGKSGNVLLTYTLVEDPVSIPWVLPPSFAPHRPQPLWMYDEIEVEPATNASSSRMNRVYRHWVLFNNGWEVCVRFVKFRYTLPANAPLFVPRRITPQPLKANSA